MQPTPLELHLEKYLPQCQWRRSHLLSSQLGQGLQGTQLLTVAQAALADREANGSAANSAVVAGLLKANHCGELAIEDTTGQVSCEFSRGCIEHARIELGETVVLLKEWQFIPPANSRRCEGYLEVSQMVRLYNEQGSPPNLQDIFTVALLMNSSKTHKKLPARSRVNVVAMVTAVGEILRTGPVGSFTFAVELSDGDDPLQQFPLVVQTPSLLHVSKMLVFQEKYLFTQLRDLVMNKGMSTERRVLATTSESAILPYDSYLECQPPESKRFKGEESRSHDHNSPPPHSNSDFVSYQGVLTECLLPEVGLYRLDSSVLLYMMGRHCVNSGHGLRPGVSLELHNVHVMKLPSHLQHVSGFYCCSKSSIHISHFSQQSHPFKPFSSLNKLFSLIKKYSPFDAAYLIHAYIALKKRYRVETSYTIVKELTKIAGFSPLEKDEISDFFSSPHSCPFTRTQDHHGNQPVVASNLSDFLKALEEEVCTPQVQWRVEESRLASSESTSSLYAGCAEKVHWSYVTLSCHEIPAQVLVGQLECCPRTGYLTVKDDAAAIPVLCLMPLTTPTNSTHLDLLKAIGGTVLLSGLTVCVERKTASSKQNDSPPLTYLNARCCTVITPAVLPNKGCVDGGFYFIVVNKNCIVSTSLSGVRFSAHVMMGTSLQSLRRDTKHGDEVAWSSEAVEVALCFTDKAFKWYSYVINGGVYFLSPSSPSSSPSSQLPLLTELSQKNFLEVTCDMQLKLVDSFDLPQLVDDITALIDRVPLPGFLKKSTTNNSKWVELFSLKGIVVTHEYRVEHSTLLALPTTTTPPQLTETILALKVQSLTRPDTIMIYYRMKAGQPHPLGLLPGSIATFHSLTLRTSKSGNVYCESTASSSITLHCLSDVTGYQPPSSSELTPQMLALSTVYLSELMERLLNGSLTRKVICLHCRVTSVQRVSLQYKCLSCGCTIVDGHCMAACPLKRPAFKVEGRFVLDDGSGEGHLYASDDMVMEMMGVAQREWAELKEIVFKIGHLVYSKGYSDQQPQVTSGGNSVMLPPRDRGKTLITKFALREITHRPLKVYGQPFVSSAELKECEVGRKQQVRRGYSTLSLPRLQLRALAVLRLLGSTGVCSNLTKQLMENYKHLSTSK